jgi:hypothetical protein
MRRGEALRLHLVEVDVVSGLGQLPGGFATGQSSTYDSEGIAHAFSSGVGNRPPQNGDLLRQRKNPDRLCMRNTLRALDFFASLHLTIFERPANFECFNSQVKAGLVTQGRVRVNP